MCLGELLMVRCDRHRQIISCAHWFFLYPYLCGIVQPAFALTVVTAHGWSHVVINVLVGHRPIPQAVGVTVHLPTKYSDGGIWRGWNCKDVPILDGRTTRLFYVLSRTISVIFRIGTMQCCAAQHSRAQCVCHRKINIIIFFHAHIFRARRRIRPD